MPTDMKSTPTIGHKRCGCDCKNQTEHAPCEDDPGDGSPPVPRAYNVCCEHCPGGAPSAYAVLFECCVDCAPVTFAPRIMFLWRDCQFVDCKWSGRYCTGNVLIPGDTGCIAGSSVRPGFGLICDFYAGTPQDPDRAANVTLENWFPPVFRDSFEPDNQQLYYDALPFKGCQDTPYCLGGDCSRDGWHDYYGMPFSNAQTDYIEDYTFKGWELEVTSPTTATITGYDASGLAAGGVVSYECDDFDCLGRSTFKIVGDYPVWFDTTKCIALPKSLCVAPAVSQYRTPCDSPSSACACRDAGWDGAILTFGDDPCIGVETLGLPRNAELPACIADPGGPCGYFYAELTTTTGRKLGFLLWCAGTAPWNLKVYCFNEAGTTCTEVCDNSPTTEVQYCPRGEEFTWLCDDAGECCDAATPVPCQCCDEDNLPVTPLFATFDMTGGCNGSAFDGLVVQLDNTSGICIGINRWTGTAVVGSCTIRVSYRYGANCPVFLDVGIDDGAGGIATNCATTSTTSGGTACPVLNLAFTTTLDSDCECGTYSGSCSGTVTVTP